MSITKYIEFTSTYRDRNLYPLPSNFQMSPRPKQAGSFAATDTVCLSAPIFEWTSNAFNSDYPIVAGAPSNVITGIIPKSNVFLGTTSDIYTIDNSTLVLYLEAGLTFQQLKNYYIGACIVVTNPNSIPTAVSNTRRITRFQYLGLNIFNDIVTDTIIDSSGNLYVVGGFTYPYNYIAMWNGTEWTDVGGGLNGSGGSIAIDSLGNLYVGGTFTKAGSIDANSIAKWNPNTSSWSALSTGLTPAFLTATCFTIAIDSLNNVYVGGVFSDAGGVADTKNIAMWTPVGASGSWYSVGGGLTEPYNAICKTIVINSGNIYVGGQFTQVGPVTTVNNIAIWNGINWSTNLNGGLTGGIATICNSIVVISSGNFYAGGIFTDAGGVTVSNIARWDGFSWNDLSDGLNGECYSISYESVTNKIYVGGNFTTAGGDPAGNIARWNITSSSWDTLSYTFDGTVFSITIKDQNNLYVGGDFSYKIAYISGNNISYIGNYDKALIEVFPPFNDSLLIEQNICTFSITDPSDFSDPSYPLLFVPKGLYHVNGYIDYILYNETVKEYRKVASYDEISHILKLDCLLDPISSSWKTTDNYSLRKNVPYFINVLTSPSTLASVYITNGSSVDDFYTYSWIRIIPTQPSYYYLKYDIPVDNYYAQVAKIVSYNGTTKIAQITSLNYIPPVGSNFEILQFSYDNAQSFVYSAVNKEVSDYRVDLINVVLPNLTLNCGYGGRISRYPYVYVQILNVTMAGGGVKNLMLSNNPNAINMIFRCPINDINRPENSPFIKVDGNSMPQFFRFTANDDLQFQVILPNGDLYQTVIQDFYQPVEPNYQVQISAVFAFTKL